MYIHAQNEREGEGGRWGGVFERDRDIFQSNKD